MATVGVKGVYLRGGGLLSGPKQGDAIVITKMTAVN